MAGWDYKRSALAVVLAGAVLLGPQPGAAEPARDAATQKDKPVQETEPVTAPASVPENTQEQNMPPEKKLKITSEYTFTNNNVSGPGQAASSLSRGSHFADVLTFDWNNTVNGNGLSLNFTLNLTDDSTVDPKRLSLTNFLLNYASPTHNAAFGDVAGSFSPYSLSGSVKGLSYRYQNEAQTGPEISFIYGSQYARWDNFWDNDPATQSTPRMVGAARVKQQVADGLTVGMNFVRTHDRWRLNDYTTLYDTRVWSSDWEYKPTPFWTHSGEFARSVSGEAATGAGYAKYTGSAVRFTSVMEKGQSRFDAEYERVTPYFLTLAGSAGVDREKLKTGWRDRLGLGSTYHVTAYWDRNNLAGQLTASDQNINYEAGVTFRQAFGRENGAFDISLVRNREHDTATTNKLDKTLNFNYKDNFHGIDTDATVGYTRTDNAAAASQYSWTHNLTLSGNLVRGKTTIVPTLTIAHNKQAYSDFSSRVMTREYSLGFTVNYESGDTLSLTGGWKNADYYALADNSNNWFANLNWTFKPAFLKALGATSMYVKVGINDYRYTTSSRNYRENSVATGVTCEF
ncbi:MAG TPA: hypothetical protein VN521_03700 [Negativicutes bacterium]|nr:hypothetical protein [Negativicutes bacterium]